MQVVSSTALIALLALALAGVAVVLRRRTRLLERANLRLERESQALERLQTTFARFAPDSVVDRIARSGISGEGSVRDVTVLFADVIGFTKIAPTLEPDTLVRLLNGYMRAMSRAVAEHRGHVSKLIGDGMMVLFGAIENNPWQADDAAHAALAMFAALDRYNAETARDGLPPLTIGIGIHRGPAVAGLMGSPELMEFTVIGETVNLASRVEKLTRTLGARVLLTEAVAKTLDRRFVVTPREPATVKGIERPLVTYSLDGFGSAN